MSFFFLILSAILYGLCQLLACRAKGTGAPLHTIRFLLAGPHELVAQSTVDWIAQQSFLKLCKGSSPERLIAEQKQSLLSFGTFYKFQLETIGDQQQVTVSVYPKFVSTTYESALISQSYRGYLTGLIEAL